jgi:hypothetical protein
MSDPICTCGHPRSKHQAATLFRPAEKCTARFWATGEPDCSCEQFVSMEQAERDAIRGES